MNNATLIQALETEILGSYIPEVQKEFIAFTEEYKKNLEIVFTVSHVLGMPVQGGVVGRFKIDRPTQELIQNIYKIVAKYGDTNNRAT